MKAAHVEAGVRANEPPSSFVPETGLGQEQDGKLNELNLPGAWRLIDKFILFLTGAAICAVGTAFATLIALEVVSRYLFGYSAVWADASATFLLVWFFMLGAPLALRQRAHVGFELMLRYLPASMGSVVYVVAQILIFAFLVTMFWSGYRGLASALRQTDAALQISLFWVMLSIPVGFFLMAYTQLALIAEKFFNSQTKERV